ncbi:carboxypeptidase-like regulatory domain-containing protein [Pedobacter sp. GSP4]|uniref:carboxypeptidase-like regulatory domain-containing protein n=1 Tax=Pedobacter sp. GSP4 TaxID=3453716 RepID=UPI003EECD1BD
MHKSFKLQIPKPCQEQWYNMQEDLQGRFCNSCQKSLIDFTGFSDAELKDWFMKNQGKSCGRFKPEQLDRLIHIKPRYSITDKFRPSLIMASLLTFLSFPKLSSANIPHLYPMVQLDEGKFFKNDVLDTLDEGFVILKGKVTDRGDKLPIIGASIMVKGSKITTFTDRNGYFELKLNKKEFNHKVFLDLKYIGYKTKSVKVNLKKANAVLIEMKMDSFILGELAIIKQPTFFDWIAQLFNG